MRIIGGRFRRRQLASPRGRSTRPTSDRLRETLFNILGASVENARVLDAFAGTGAVGLEALSRGAARAVFVESDPRELAVVAENVRRCGAESDCALVQGRFPAALHPASQFDLVFLDPPYDTSSLDDLVAAAAGFVAPGGGVVLEHSRRREAPIEVRGLTRARLVSAGDSALSFYGPAAPASDHD